MVIYLLHNNIILNPCVSTCDNTRIKDKYIDIFFILFLLIYIREKKDKKYQY